MAVSFGVKNCNKKMKMTIIDWKWVHTTKCSVSVSSE